MNRLKRKPYLFGIGAAVLVLALVAAQFARPSRAESPRLERFLPADAVGFVQVNDLRAQALRVIATRTTQPARCKPRSTSTALYAAIPPETPSATFIPDTVS